MCPIIQSVSLLFVIDFGSLVFVRLLLLLIKELSCYAEITRTNGVIVIFFQPWFRPLDYSRKVSVNGFSIIQPVLLPTVCDA